MIGQNDNMYDKLDMYTEGTFAWCSSDVRDFSEPFEEDFFKSALIV